MFQHRFYHSLLKKYTALFGNYFNDIQISRKDEVNNTVQTLKVPLAYSPVAKIQAQRDSRKSPQTEENNYTAILLPRMGFEITGISYDPSRQQQATIRNRTISGDPKFAFNSFIAVPYNIDFALYIIAKNTEDNLQIVEQILPFFTPDIVTTVNLVPELGIKQDIPLILTGVSQTDNYEEDITERRLLIWTLTFQMKAYLIGPVSKNGVIKKAIVDFYILPGNPPITADEQAKAPRSTRITAQPGLTANGQPTTVLNESIPYYLINEDDNYGFIETYGDFNDGKRRNNETGTDEPVKSR